MKILIQHGQVINPAIDPTKVLNQRADVVIADGKIVGVGAVPDGFTPDQILDATGLIVAPGLVDVSARLREPGTEHKATLHSELAAALHGGVTSLACPPDTEPVLDEPGLVEMLKFRARNLRLAHVYPQGALTVGLRGEDLTEMNQLAAAGCVGFGQADQPITNTQVLLRAMQYAHTFGYTLWLRPQDPWLGKGGVAHAGAVATRLGLSGVSVSSETVALHTLFELVRATGCRVHVCRLSSAAGVELVRLAKREGLPVTADVAIANLHLIDIDIGYFNSQMRFSPPLRSERDRNALTQGVIDGTIDAITSDHCPLDDDEKLLPFDQASPGASGVELLLPLTLQWAQRAGVAVPEALQKISANPARILGIAAGTLSVGADADVCVYSPNQTWQVTRQALVSQGKNTPFLGWEMPVRVAFTLVEGQVVYSGQATTQ